MATFTTDVNHTSNSKAVYRLNVIYIYVHSTFFQSTKEESKLKCFMTSSSLPLSFNKEEVYNSYPRISVFYDILREEELRQLQNTTSDRVTLILSVVVLLHVLFAE